jgi:uncharacterized protein (TIGR02594 family)
LPARYRWLAGIAVPPRIITEGLRLLGTTETPGPASNPAILGWRDELRAAGCQVEGYSADATPWCGLFAAIVVLRAGKRPVDAPLWAMNWRRFGSEAARPALGDVLVFERAGGGHVGFYIAEDPDCLHVLGGNQHDAVSIARIARSRCVAMRRPPYAVKPASAVPVAMAASGEVSFDEA